MEKIMKRISVLICAAILFCSVLVYGQDDETLNPDRRRVLPTMTLTLQGHKVTAEIAAGDSDRRYGLMWRKSMEQNHGMLFIFDTEQNASFWMKNTLIPLDLAYIDASGKVTQIETMAVYKKGDPKKHYNSKTKIKYALELNAGWFEKKGIGPGFVIPELKK